MENLKRIISESVSSIFTKQDILNLLEQHQMEQPETPCLTKEQYDKIKEKFERAMDMSSERNEVIEVGTAQFSIDHNNTLILDQVDVDMELIGGHLDAALETVFEILPE